MSRATIRRAHLVAGLLGFLAILIFWTSTAATELSGSHAAIAAVKSGILWGMLVLVPAMALAGATGFGLGGRSKAALVTAKRRRMPVIALNGLLVLLPSAVFLAGRAGSDTFDAAFYTVQAIELVAGALNLVLMGLNIRDGLRLSGWRNRTKFGSPGPSAVRQR
jgi:hypothetical protein